MSESEKKPERASAADREYMARVARQMRELDDEVAPGSLAETLARMDAIARRLGRWAKPGVEGESDGDLYAHLAMTTRKPRVS